MSEGVTPGIYRATLDNREVLITVRALSVPSPKGRRVLTVEGEPAPSATLHAPVTVAEALRLIPRVAVTGLVTPTGELCRCGLPRGHRVHTVGTHTYCRMRWELE